MPRLHFIWPVVLLAACGREAPREPLATRQAVRTSRVSQALPDTAVFVAQQAGQPTAAVSAVMQLRVAARDAQVTLESAAGRRATTGAVGSEAREEIPGSRAVSVGLAPDSASWQATVSIPVLDGERYLVELYPSTPRLDSASLDLSADGTRLFGVRIAADATPGVPALFEVSVSSRHVVVSPQIERVEIVPTCGTAHVVRSGGRADLYAQYLVVETGENGDVHLPPRAPDAQFRAVSFRTRTRGAVRITYLGHVLAEAARPEACPD